MSKLTWIACSGVKPKELADDAHITIIWRQSKNRIVEATCFYPINAPWNETIAYALENVDPVKELVEAANILSEQERKAGILMSHWFRLRDAIKAVEDMEDE